MRQWGQRASTCLVQATRSEGLGAFGERTDICICCSCRSGGGGGGCGKLEGAARGPGIGAEI